MGKLLLGLHYCQRPLWVGTGQFNLGNVFWAAFGH